MNGQQEPPPEIESMNDYQVTFTNGKIVVITAWTPEAAQSIAEEDADSYGCQGLSAVSVTLLTSPALES
jgi:hypothetical protein